MISAPVTGPEEALAGGGRLAVPSRSIVCSLTVAAPKQTVFLIYMDLENQDLYNQAHLSTSSHEL